VSLGAEGRIDLRERGYDSYNVSELSRRHLYVLLDKGPSYLKRIPEQVLHRSSILSLRLEHVLVVKPLKRTPILG